MLRFAIVLTAVLTLAASAVQAQDHCYREAEIIEVSGSLTLELYPGRPNYASIEDGDEPELVYILHADRPICLLAESPEDGSLSRRISTSLHIGAPLGADSLPPGLGKQVTVAGELFTGFNGHHHRPILLLDAQLVSSRP